MGTTTPPITKTTGTALPPVLPDKTTPVADPKTKAMIDNVNTFVNDQEKKITAKPEKDMLTGLKTEDELVKGQKLQQEAANEAELERDRIKLYRDTTQSLER